jgi:hypothetical protein
VLPLLLFSSCTGQVRLVDDKNARKVDVLIGGNLFTTFCYPEKMEKPFLFPINAPDGSVVTRGFPLEPRKGERVDHPHHIGLWFNHGNINGLDFWNNSSAIPENKKSLYGNIAVNEIVKAEGGESGLLEVKSDWMDQKGNKILAEQATYIFSGGKDYRVIDHISVLTASSDTVVFNDSKEGMFAIRVDRAFEMPTKDALIFTDDKGNPTTVKATDNTGVTGMYRSSSGNTGDDVWGKRNEWVILEGVKNDRKITMVIFDHPENPGFPAYSHARGYGLFSVNNFGRKSYDPGQQEFKFILLKGESVKLIHRFYIRAGEEVTSGSAKTIYEEFTHKY